MTLRFTQPEGRWSFKFCDWSEGETSWVLLYLVDGESALHAWSSKLSTAEDREQLMTDVTKSSNEVDNKYDLIDAFMDQSRNWSFWGSGIPSPIADYYDSVLKSRLRKQLHSWSSRVSVMSRLYAYVGPQEVLDDSRSSASGSVIRTTGELIGWLHANSADSDVEGLLTATFVIDKNGELRLAPRRSEHVACAAGGSVLSAGEMTFTKTGEVIAVNNHSTGFCPEPESWPACEKALTRIGIHHPEGFTKSVVFRLCPKCKERNIVKDNWFTCDLCGADLPHEWNFQTDAATNNVTEAND